MSNYFSISDGDDKIMLGQVAMLPDPKHGGIMARTFLNATLSEYSTCNLDKKVLFRSKIHLVFIDGRD